MKSEPGISVSCHLCGASHEVSRLAVNTVCPSCGTRISLEDVRISREESRLIDTRGRLVVERGAYLYSPFAVCREAEIFGKISGILICEELCRVRVSGVQPVQIRSGEFVVDKGAFLRCPFPVQARSVRVCGHLAAEVYCSGRLVIARGGIVEGNVFAKSIQTDKGAQLLGALRIGPFDPPRIDLPTNPIGGNILPVALPSPRRRRVVTIAE